MFRNKNRPILFQLLFFFMILTLTGSIFLFRTITNYGYSQLGDIIENAAKVANIYSKRSLNNYYEWQLQWLSHKDISSTIQGAIERYYKYDEYSFTILPKEWIDYQDDQLKAQFGPQARLTYDLFSSDREIFYSSMGHEGERFSFFDQYSYFKDFNEGKRKENYLFGLGIEDGELFVKLIIPYDSRYGRSYIGISSYGLDINKLFNIEVMDAFPGDIYLVNSAGRIFYNTSRDKAASKGLKIPDELFHSIKNGFNKNNFRPYIFKDDKDNRVIGLGTWVDMLGTGILLTLPANIVLGPSYYLASLILVITVFFLLLFLLVTIAIDRNRVKAFDHNPLTHLPGNQVINRHIIRAFKSGGELIVYLDLDNFKAYNDIYGFSAGDSVIVFTAKLLNEFISPIKKGFIGHIGGDDFVVIGSKDEVIRQLTTFGTQFDREIIKFYSERDRQKGYIEARDRQNNLMKFPFVSISMGGFLAEPGLEVHPLKIAEQCAEVKKLAKLEKGSKLIIDRRSF